MKYVTFLRHGKAVRPEDAASDFDRPLTHRGHRDIATVAALLSRLDPAVDCIVASTAARAAQSAVIAQKVLDLPGQIGWNEALYLASSDVTLAQIQRIPDDKNHVLVVGHNPGFEEITSLLCCGVPERAVLVLPTAAFAFLEIDTERWELVRPGAGLLRGMVAAKWLRP